MYTLFCKSAQCTNIQFSCKLLKMVISKCCIIFYMTFHCYRLVDMLLLIVELDQLGMQSAIINLVHY